VQLPRPLAQIFEVTFFVPIGILSLARRQWPACAKRAAQNRQAVINRVQLAQLAARVAAERAQRPARTTSAAPSPRATSGARARGGTARATRTATVPAHDLPVSDYESLAAIHVVHRLATLRPDELERVREFEQTHRARRTILAKIEQLQDSAT
jgi:hypothetical protein